jgi:hypothetical protein
MEMRRVNRLLVLIALVLLGGCTKKKTGRDAGEDGGVGAIGPPALAPLPTCPKLAPNEVTEEMVPPLVGPLGDAIESLPWFQARGVSLPTLTAIWMARIGRGIDRSLAESDAQGYCRPLTVGDKHEEAMACTATSHDSMMIERLLVLVVRNRQPVVVLDLGIASYAMDWPEARYLDLALTFAPDGMSAIYKDRAPPGTKLVADPKWCEEQVKVLAECRVDAGPECPVPPPTVADEDGGIGLGIGFTLGGPMNPPALLNGCAEAKDGVKELQKPDVGDKQMREEARYVGSFITRSCAALGRYEWKGGRFVRAGA